MYEDPRFYSAFRDHERCENCYPDNGSSDSRLNILDESGKRTPRNYYVWKSPRRYRTITSRIYGNYSEPRPLHPPTILMNIDNKILLVLNLWLWNIGNYYEIGKPKNTGILVQYSLRNCILDSSRRGHLEVILLNHYTNNYNRNCIVLGVILNRKLRRIQWQ